MPTFMDFHSMGRFTEENLRKSQNEPRDEFGVRLLNTFYDMDSGMMFCLFDAPDRYAVETSFKVRDKMRLDYSGEDDRKV